ncbi:phospholipase A2 inhibitor and Ly6/PLAUR domain-containing protein-like isoform X2 [Hyla sarda]|uniref:phospholipase A2 inhibitor and Ly6/PLAUR domain-containing protein-like isoform X2 n=1 Tax=Hyla sarda TaxID=327740 RepID=UPI0024C307A7|nr:phospholipase A2 inhibitor and Ly6/PLAUR domain-containing protein-like isoform X2 [Hyla sarda]XP_056399084.1 phospholipase A2 inhibitor and Ly6/PLAUR domain-containing protein-like isoform X2 [Hyla sarda]XP_056399085.1 phospholipase A2 inhibitor and Ly6/PLAUR domain-containing protein-like isoform X2 [Hyla sarda]
MMGSFILSLVIFCAISWTGLALQCLECLKTDSDTCEGVSVECPNSAECVVISELYHPRDIIKHSIKRGCNTGFPCDSVNYLSNFYDKEIRSYVKCCTEDNCNTGDFYIPPEPTEHNGKTCTSCYEDGLEECISDRTAQCLNEDDQCLDYIGTFKDPDHVTQERSFKGCGSPLACQYKFDALISLEELETLRFGCE